MGIPRPTKHRTIGGRFTAMYVLGMLGLTVGVIVVVNLFAGGVTDTEPVPTVQLPVEQRIAELSEELDRTRADQSDQILAGSLAGLAVAAGGSILLGRLFTARVLRPLRDITSATRGITADDLSRRLAVDGPADEVKQLADTIDDLLERLEESFESQRRFAANASHELRTPLATMRAAVDVAEAKPDASRRVEKLAGRIRGELDRIDPLLDGLLALARTQRLDEAEQSVVEVGSLIACALRDREHQVRAADLTVEVGAGDSSLRGSRVLITRLVDNLIDNAITHNRPGGRIDIEVSTDEDRLLLSVSNTGPVLPDEVFERLGRPFNRLTRGRTGLGLSIVESICRCHDGRVAYAAGPGGGLAVTVDLPLHREAP